MTILDSDIFTLLTYEHANVVCQYQAVPEGEQLAVTAVTRIEVLRGRTDNLLKAADEHELLAAAKPLRATEACVNDFLVVHVDAEAAKHFKVLLGQKKLKIRRPDMLIACIALLRRTPFSSPATRRISVRFPG